jgi:dTDP-4-amino-4,6-dideoxygalactose transaminase
MQSLAEGAYSSFHLYLIKLDLEKVKYSHKVCHEKMRGNGIFVNLHYRPIYLMPYYMKLNEKFKKGYCENSEHYAETAMSLPIHTRLKKVEIDYVIKNLKSLFS